MAVQVVCRCGESYSVTSLETESNCPSCGELYEATDVSGEAGPATIAELLDSAKPSVLEKQREPRTVKHVPVIIAVFALTVILGVAFALIRAPSNQPKKSSPLADWQWIRERNYEVDFPGRPQPLQVRREVGEGWVIESLPLGKFLVGDYALGVLGKGSDKKLNPQKALRTFANLLAGKYPRKMTSTLLPGPLHGIEIQRAQIGSGTRHTRFMRLRLILTSRRVYLVQWSGRAREDKRAAAGVNRFFDSFRLTKAATEPTSPPDS